VVREAAGMRELLFACAKQQSIAVRPVKPSVFIPICTISYVKLTFSLRDAKDHQLACGFMGLLENVGITEGSARQTTSPPTQTTKGKKKKSQTPGPDSASLASLTLEDLD
jgi:hypothetical protein